MKWARTAACNIVVPKAAVTNFYNTFVLYSILIFQINSIAETPCLRQYPNRYQQAADSIVEQIVKTDRFNSKKTGNYARG